MTTKTEKRKPVHEVKAGSVRAAVWENDGREGVFYTFTLERLYKASEGWRSTNTFSHRDPSNLSAAAAMASSWIAERVAEQAQTATPEANGNVQSAAA